MEEECNDLLHNEICYHFPQLKKQIATFIEKIELYRKDYGNKILSVLPKVRGQGGEEQELAQLIDKKENSPFSSKAMQEWLDIKKMEAENLQTILNMLDQTTFVKQENLKSYLYDTNIKFIISFTLKICWEEYCQPFSINKTRAALENFKNLKLFNKGSDDLKFLVTEESLLTGNHSQTGAFVSLYVGGVLENEDFRSSLKPKNLRVLEKRDSSVKITWDGDITNTNFVKSYKISYSIDQKFEVWSHIEEEWTDKNTPTVTLSNLQPATTYQIKVCAFNKIQISEWSEVLYVTTRLYPLEIHKILSFCELLEPSNNGATAVFGLPLKLVKKDEDKMIRKYEVNLNKEQYTQNDVSKPHKVILMVSLKCPGKNSLVNAMVNYILCVKWEDKVHLKLIYNQIEDRRKGEVCIYTLHHVEGFKVIIV